jgi:nitrile hydratase subunit beta
VDGIHDMGGMHGFGAVAPEPDEPTFHEPWEARTFGLSLVAGATGAVRGSSRARIEAMPPADYLAASYYARWAYALEAGLVATGSLTTAEIDARVAGDPGKSAGPGATAPQLVAAVKGFLDAPQPTSGLPVPAETAFSVGDEVTVRRMAPERHQRCPRYVRGATGTVVRVAGAWRHPGDPADAAEPVYTVRFAMTELWGDDAEPGTLAIDLWERYLA